MVQLFVVHHHHGVRAVEDQLPGQGVHAVTDDHGGQIGVQGGRQLLALAQQLQGNLLDFAGPLLHKDHYAFICFKIHG